MKKKVLISLVVVFGLFVIWLLIQSNSSSIDLKNIVSPFENYIPAKFSDGLEMSELDKRTTGEKFREVDIYDLSSTTGEKTTKRISVDDGYRAMYSYSGTQYFANVKIEKSVNGEFEKDKIIVIEYIKHLFDRKTKNVKDATEKNSETKKKIEEELATGQKDYLSFENEKYKGYEYVSYVENVIGLTEATISQIQIFAPEDDIIITAYLLVQDNAKFKTIDEFLALRQNFIKGYIDYIVLMKQK